MTAETQEAAQPETPETGDTDWQAEAEKWKSLSRKNEEKARTNSAAAKRLEEIEQANASELDKAIKKAREEGAAEVRGAANQRLLTAEARALAAEAKFRNPTLAVRAIDLSGVSVNDDGSIDSAAIKSLLKSLATDEPYLVDDGKAGRPKPDPAQGRAQGEPSKGEQGLEQARKRGFLPKQ